MVIPEVYWRMPATEEETPAKEIVPLPRAEALPREIVPSSIVVPPE